MPLNRPAIDALCNLLKTGDEADRCYTSRALGVIGDEAAVSRLIEHLVDEDIDVCVDAAEALGNIGAKAAVPALVQSLQNEQSGEICTAVTVALGKIGGSEAITALLKVAVERPEGMEWDDDWDTWWNVQLEAVKALGRFGTEQAAEPLVNILQDESQQDIESEILRALANIPGPGTTFLMARLEEMESIPQYRRRAARALGQVTTKTPEITQALGRALKDEAPEVRSQALTSLAGLDGERYLRALILMLRDENDSVRSAAIDALTGLSIKDAGETDLQHELLPLLNDPSSKVRLALFNTLLNTVGHTPLSDEARHMIVASLDDTEAETATAACVLLGKNGDHTVVENLLSVLDNELTHPMVRREAALTIGKLKHYDHAVAASLSRTIGDRQQAVRLASLAALVALDNTGISTVSFDESEFPDPPLTVVIAALQGEIGPGASVPKDDADNPGTNTEDAEAGEENEQETQLDLPDTATEIVQESDVKSALSTLEAISMANVESAMHHDSQVAQPEYDEETREYLALVEGNKQTMVRIRSNRKFDPHQDTRRLSARVLAESDSDLAIAALIEALNDDEALLRSEAANSIGLIAQRTPGNPALMDALGSMVTQLTVGDQDQRLGCARALGNLGNLAAILPLTEALKDPLPNVRIQAIEALSKLTAKNTDSTQSNHMVVRKVSPLSAARKLIGCLNDSEMGVRVCTARELPTVLKLVEEEKFRDQALDKVIDSVMQWSGEEARLIGKSLRAFDRHACIEKLLDGLQHADNSLKRSVIIEMLEELLKPEFDQQEQVA